MTLDQFDHSLLCSTVLFHGHIQKWLCHTYWRRTESKINNNNNNNNNDGPKEATSKQEFHLTSRNFHFW